MRDEDFQRTLAFFAPCPSEAEWPAIRIELTSIAKDYKHDAAQKRLIRAPFARAGETDAEYGARVQALLDAPVKPGRPNMLAQKIMVVRLRDLLMKHGCHYGAPKLDDRRSRLAELAEFIHDLVEAPRKRIGWRSIAEQLADPIAQLEVALGDGLTIQGSRTAIKEWLSKAQHKPTKRRN